MVLEDWLAFPALRIIAGFAPLRDSAGSTHWFTPRRRDAKFRKEKQDCGR